MGNMGAGLGQQPMSMGMGMGQAGQNQAMVPQPNLMSLLQQLGQQAAPRPQPSGYNQSIADARLGLIKELQPSGGSFDQYRADELSRFQNQVLPQMAGQLRGAGLGAFQQATAGGLQDLAGRLGQQRLGYEQNRQGLLSGLLGQQENMGLRQQELGLQGLQGIGGLQQRYAEGPLQQQIQLLQLLLSGRGNQAQLGMGQGGDVAMDQGALTPLASLITQALSAYAKGGRV